jgi:hypothetical protein
LQPWAKGGRADVGKVLAVVVAATVGLAGGFIGGFVVGRANPEHPSAAVIQQGSQPFVIRWPITCRLLPPLNGYGSSYMRPGVSIAAVRASGLGTDVIEVSTASRVLPNGSLEVTFRAVPSVPYLLALSQGPQYEWGPFDAGQVPSGNALCNPQ